MKMKAVFVISLWLTVIQLTAQDEKLTTFILVRHAEREVGQGSMAPGKDPNLSEDGMKRAERLVSVFSKTKIDVVYSTPFIRTRKTVEPLAQSKSLTVKEYEPNKLEAIDQMLRDHEGKTILVCGHSNTIPKIANHLSKSGNLNDFDDTEYGNILIVTISKSNLSKIIWLTY